MVDPGVQHPLHGSRRTLESVMNENQIEGGSGPALAAHSKDASTPGPTSASSATGNQPSGSSSAGETASSLSGQARDAASRMGASVPDAAGRARQSLSAQSGRVADQGSAFVRKQPFVALALTG